MSLGLFPIRAKFGIFSQIIWLIASIELSSGNKGRGRREDNDYRYCGYCCFCAFVHGIKPETSYRWSMCSTSEPFSVPCRNTLPNQHETGLFGKFTNRWNLALLSKNLTHCRNYMPQGQSTFLSSWNSQKNLQLTSCLYCSSSHLYIFFFSYFKSFYFDLQKQTTDYKRGLNCHNSFTSCLL